MVVRNISLRNSEFVLDPLNIIGTYIISSLVIVEQSVILDYLAVSLHYFTYLTNTLNAWQFRLIDWLLFVIYELFRHATN